MLVAPILDRARRYVLVAGLQRSGTYLALAPYSMCWSTLGAKVYLLPFKFTPQGEALEAQEGANLGPHGKHGIEHRGDNKGK
jgi:hypothetical protein